MVVELKGKAALVTGGGSGICLAFTKALVSKGCNVLIVDLQLRPEAEALVHASDELTGGARVIFKKTDVLDWTQLQEAFDVAIAEFGGLDIVCPGAGIFEPSHSSFWHLAGSVDTPETSNFQTLELNITHPVRTTQLAIDIFRRLGKKAGVVLLISSIAAQMELLPCPLYAASKAAISSFTRSLEYLDPAAGIRVVAVAPGLVKTPIWTEDKLSWVDEEKDTWVSIEKLADVMVEMVEKEQVVGGTVLEVGADGVRRVEVLMDPGSGGERGLTVGNIELAFKDVFGLLKSEFGKEKVK